MNLAELCQQLKQKRGERGLTIEQVVEKTKLYPSAIRDIEEGDISAMNPTYLKGFLKIYASFLGVPVDNALDEISANPNPRKEKKERKEKIEKSMRFKLPSIEISPQVKRLALLAVVGCVALWILISFVRFVAMHIPRSTKKTATRVVETSEPVMPQQSRQSASKEVFVSITAKRNCYVKVKVDGRTMYQGIISRGKVESWRAAKELEFRISDGSAVYLEVNGKSLPPLTSMRKAIKSLKVTSSGISVAK